MLERKERGVDVAYPSTVMGEKNKDQPLKWLNKSPSTFLIQAYLRNGMHVYYCSLSHHLCVVWYRLMYCECS